MGTAGEHPLIVLKFEGPTFERHELPANALRELALFQETFVDVAADLWRARNPRSGRLPNGFAAKLEPRMNSLGAGSVEVGYASPGAALSGAEDERYAEGASFASETSELVLAALQEGAAGRVHLDLSLKTIERLSKLGSSLDEADSIIAHDGRHPPVRLDCDARGAFRRAAAHARAADAEAPSATIGDLVALIDHHFGDVPDEVWDASPPVEPHGVQAAAEHRR